MAYLSFPGIYGCLNNIQDTSPNLPSPKFALSSDIGSINWEDYGAFDRPVLASRHLSIDEIIRERHHLQASWQYSVPERLMRRVKRMFERIPPRAT
jgi:hypothetical protein